MRANVSAAAQVDAARGAARGAAGAMGDPARWSPSCRRASPRTSGATRRAPPRRGRARPRRPSGSLASRPQSRRPTRRGARLADLAAAERSLRRAEADARTLEETHRLVTQAAQAVPGEFDAARTALRQATTTREQPRAGRRRASRRGAARDRRRADALETDAARRPTRTIDRIARLRDRLDLALGDARTAQQRLRGARTALPGTLAAARSAIAQAEASVAHTRAGADARCGSLSAQRELAVARQAPDPVAALDAARRAMRDAEDARPSPTTTGSAVAEPCGDRVAIVGAMTDASPRAASADAVLGRSRRVPATLTLIARPARRRRRAGGACGVRSRTPAVRRRRLRSARARRRDAGGPRSPAPSSSTTRSSTSSPSPSFVGHGLPGVPSRITRRARATSRSGSCSRSSRAHCSSGSLSHAALAVGADGGGGPRCRAVRRHHGVHRRRRRAPRRSRGACAHGSCCSASSFVALLFWGSLADLEHALAVLLVLFVDRSLRIQRTTDPRAAADRLRRRPGHRWRSSCSRSSSRPMAPFGQTDAAGGSLHRRRASTSVVILLVANGLRRGRRWAWVLDASSSRSSTC